MSKIEMGKQYETRSGLPVRILCTDRARNPENEWSVLVLINEGGLEVARWCLEDGTNSITKGSRSDYDLIEVKPRIKREYWVNVYPTGLGALRNSKKDADCASEVDKRIACVPVIIDCEEGEGLT